MFIRCIDEPRGEGLYTCTAMSNPNTHEESEDFKLMRRYDAEWPAQRLILHGAVWLAIALAVIYALASRADG